MVSSWENLKSAFHKGEHTTYFGNCSQLTVSAKCAISRRIVTFCRGEQAYYEVALSNEGSYQIGTSAGPPLAQGET